MPKNLLKRIYTSIFLLFLLFVVTFSHRYIFISSILLLSLIICLEAKNIFLKILGYQNFKQIIYSKKVNLNFFILNLISFCYLFFIFCNFSYGIFKFEGPTFFLYLVSICFCTDIGGYVFGKSIGGMKLTKISPNKTISGTIGSFIFSIIPLFIFSKLNYLDIELNLNIIIFNLLVSLISQLGDLFISYLKRKAKIKDISKILPGHGGVLDRVDGIIFAIPFSYFLLKLI